MRTAFLFYQSFCKFPTADAGYPQYLQMFKGHLIREKGSLTVGDNWNDAAIGLGTSTASISPYAQDSSASTVSPRSSTVPTNRLDDYAHHLCQFWPIASMRFPALGLWLRGFGSGHVQPYRCSAPRFGIEDYICISFSSAFSLGYGNCLIGFCLRHLVASVKAL